MKKRLLMLLCLSALAVGVSGQVNDAFQSVLPVTDAKMKKTLNGEWKLKVVKGVTDDRSVPEADATWGRIPVPGCWEAYGFCSPTYDKADALTGYYRTTFVVPREWKGQRIVLRFDGVLYGYDIWVNGKEAGSWRSGYNTALFDITKCLRRQGEQELALRVITQFPGSDFDYNDDWAPTGIFRDVTLMAVPETHLADLTILTENSGKVDVETKVTGKGAVVKHEILDANGQVVGTDHVEHPHLWTAETPYLYTLRTTLTKGGKTLQTFHHRFGFRDISIDGNVLKLNGRAIKLRGVTSHSTDPVSVKVIDESLTLKDMKLMKEASVNYIRTSHYPREPRFYELADSLGFYIIDEVPFGYGDKNLSKAEFYPTLQQRAQATIRRDKNHPSVLIWSLGNENPLTDICIQLGEYVKKELDASRPYCYPQVGSYFRRFFEGEQAKGFPSAAPIYAPHYPTTEQIAGFFQRLDRPVIFTEYCHTLGISLEDHDRQWETIQRTPGIAGGSVWEWVDQGMPFKAELKSPYGYEEKVYTSKGGGFEMFGNKGTDGLLYADRTPLPNYYELQHNYARALVRAVNCVDGEIRLNIENRFDFLDLKDQVTFHWALTEDRDTVAQGAFSPACRPHQEVEYTIAQATTSAHRYSLLHIDISDAQGHRFLQQSFVLHKPRIDWKGSSNTAVSMLQEGPLVRAGRKSTLAENVTQKGRLPKQYLLPLDNKQVTANVRREKVDGGERISFDLTPDTADIFRAELGLAYLLDASIQRVQWIGQGPFASYPGRHQACRYGFWGKRTGDLYLEGNHGGVDAALLTDAKGNGILVVGDSLGLNFEQTDRGVVLTVNAAVAGQGPKFRKTAFPISKEVKTHSGQFCMYPIQAGQWSQVVQQLFLHADNVPAAFSPFLTQYDTYMNRYEEIIERE
ncbi:MAG: hypothetical protein IKN83_11655 [Bacteroidaceae bacterium]|nr:hypothetical protein [Bacteroidaceae bacterium]